MTKCIRYPIKKVIITYSLLGGLIGSLPLLPLVISESLEHDDFRLLFWVLIAWAVGFVPALLTGAVLAYFKVIITCKMDYFKPFWVGLAITFLCFFLPSLINVIIDLILNDANIEHMLSLFATFGVSAIFSIIGGVSSVILAKFALPKSQTPCPHAQTMR